MLLLLSTPQRRRPYSRFLMAAVVPLLLLASSSRRAVFGVLGLAASPQVPPLSKTAEHLPLAQQAMTYLDRSTDPFHAVQSSIDLLQAAGFTQLDDDEDEETSPSSSFTGRLKPGGKYYFTRNKSTLVAFCVGAQYVAGNGCKIIGGHTDSPNLRVKPRSKRTSGAAASTIQLGVECYGGGLWHTWFDRDLGISGRVLVRNTSDTTPITKRSIQQRLVQIHRPLLRISNLAIHLQTADERKAFKVNKEDHLSPILALEAKKALTSGGGGGSNNNQKEKDEKDTETKENEKEDGWSEYQEPALLQVLANELNVDVKDIVDFDLSLFDVQKAAIGGAFSEFVHSARLDNLASCFMAVQALIDHSQNDKLVSTDTDVSMIVLYDHEEVGSSSAVGAASPIMGETVQRITAAFFNNDNDNNTNNNNNFYDVHSVCLRRSFVVSADQAHAVHPNYASKHERAHQPHMNRGMVIKRNANQRYATTAVTGVLVRETARRAGLPPVQEFLVRQDCGCGSTIGPLISTATGIRTIDMGCPQLSMHSIRETMGVCDLTNGLDLFKAFFEHFRSVDSSVES